MFDPYVALAVSLAVECVISPFIIRTMDDNGDKTLKQLGIYLISFLIAASFALSGNNEVKIHWFVLSIGALNGFAVFAWMRALRISYSLTGLLVSPGVNCFGILLGIALLSEYQFAKSLTLIVGVGFCVTSSIIAIRTGWKDDKTNQIVQFVVCIFVICGVGGTVLYTHRRFSIGNEHIEIFSYLLSWYAGTLISTLLMYCVLRASNRVSSTTIKKEDYPKILMVGILFFINMLSHKAFAVGIPIIVSRPMFLAVGSIASLAIGLNTFKEGEKFARVLPLVLFFAVIGIGFVAAGVVNLR